MTSREIAVQAVRRRGAMQKPRELQELIVYLRKRPTPLRGVLEIGGMHGGTTWAWAQFAIGPLVCIDMFALEGRMTQAEDVGYELVEGDSHLESTRERVAGTFDMLFIDGDHSYAGVRRDFELYAPLVRPGGVVALHDVSVEQPVAVRSVHDVVPYWNQLCALYDHKEIFDVAGAPWGGIGVLHVPGGPDARQEALTAALALGQPSPADRVATVPCDEPCGACGRQLVPGEDTICALCAESR